MMTRFGMGALLLAVTAGSAAAQQQQAPQPGGDRVTKAMEDYSHGKYVPPTCEALDNTGHFKVSSGRTYLKTGIETSVPENRARALGDAERVIKEAITQNGRDKSASAWYFLGRVYLYRGDIAGADTALTRAVALAPDCTKEVNELRRVAYIALVNPGITFMKAQNRDSAVAMFQRASNIAPDAPEAAYYLATMQYNAEQFDSAAANFARAAERADSAHAEMKSKAQFFGGLALLRENRAKEALPLLQAYAAAAPDDVDAKKALVNAYRAADMPDSARVIEKQLLESGALGGTAGEAGGTADVYNIGVGLYNDKKYEEAAEAFGKVLAQEPNNHDALLLQANAYLATKNGAKLTEAARKLVSLEPMNEEALKLLAEGYRQGGNMAERSKIAQQVFALPFSVQGASLTQTDSGATLTATATGRNAMTASGTAIKAAPVTLTVEFLDAAGTVVDTQTVTVPALAEGAKHEISVTGNGAKIASWRYSRKK